MTIDKWSIGGSAREPAREPERAGSARLGILASREKKLGSARSRLASRSELSRAEPLRARAGSRAASFFSSPSGIHLGPSNFTRGRAED